jgi:site-specific DNA recombinase
MEIDEAEASILREMGNKLLDNYSFKEIAYWANEQGYETAEGKMWYPVTIRNTLRRVRYAGVREHHGAQFSAAWPAVFDSATWERMQLKIKLSADRFADRPKARKYLLTGRVYCGKCGSSLNGETKRDHPGRPLRPVYQCRVHGNTQRAGGCGGVTVNAEALNWYIRESVFDHIDPEKVAELLRDNERVVAS